MSHAALLAAIRALPGEDTPRLALADLLDEEGPSPRAEFIRLQIKLAAMPDFDPRKPTLEDREQELLAAHEAAWLGDWPAEVRDWTWERGFVAAAEVRGSELAAIGDRVFVHPVSRLRLVTDPYTGSAPKNWPSFHARPWLSQIEDFDARHGTQSNDRVPGLLIGDVLASPHLTNLKRLALTRPDRLGVVRSSRPPDDPAGPDASGRELGAHLLASRARETLESVTVESHHIDPGEGTRLGRNWHRFPRLVELGFSMCQFGNALLRGLAAGPARRRLARLDISNTESGRFTLDDLFSGGPLTALRELNLGQARLTPRDLQRVADGPACPSLRVLHAGGRWHSNEFGEPPDVTDFASVVVGSDFWRRATGLSLKGNGLDASHVGPLFRSSRPAGLRDLHLGSNRLDAVAVEELCAASWLGRLTRLKLTDNLLTKPAFAALGACKSLGCLRKLDLGRRRWCGSAEPQTSDVLALCAGKALKRVSSLNLNSLRFGAAGLDAVLNGGAFPHLRDLSVSSCDLDEEALRVLARSPRLKHLRRLRMSNNPRLMESDASTWKELCESPHLSPLMALELSGPVTGALSAALRARLGARWRAWGA